MSDNIRYALLGILHLLPIVICLLFRRDADVLRGLALLGMLGIFYLYSSRRTGKLKEDVNGISYTVPLILRDGYGLWIAIVAGNFLVMSFVLWKRWEFSSNIYFYWSILATALDIFVTRRERVVFR